MSLLNNYDTNCRLFVFETPCIDAESIQVRLHHLGTTSRIYSRNESLGVVNKFCYLDDMIIYLSIFLLLFKIYFISVFLIGQAVKLTIYTERKSKIFAYNIRK